MNITVRVKAALLDNFTKGNNAQLDAKGYTRSPQENLLSGIDLAKVEDDLRRGDGDELRMKFCAIHSSAALAVNCFAPFKDRPGDLLLLGRQSARELQFEKKLRIFRGGKASNIDVWIRLDEGSVAVESKLLEYLKPKRAKFSVAYERLAPPNSESCWWDFYRQAKQGAMQHLDRAQLIKHYFGLNKLSAKSPHLKLALLYIFWEPLNWQEVGECVRHREEVKVFSEAVSDSQIPFWWTTYNDVWEEWGASPALSHHAHNLKARYQVYL
jgi:hypothetical protein